MRDGVGVGWWGVMEGEVLCVWGRGRGSGRTEGRVHV